ncbi:MAG: hypothetical protein WAO00_17045 [Chthoniobacterales bacterium]
MKYLARLVVTFAFTSAGFSLLVLAASSDKPAHGGTGGQPFRMDCGDDKVLIGVKYWMYDWWMDSLEPICGWIYKSSSNYVTAENPGITCLLIGSARERPPSPASALSTDGM